MAGDSLLLSEVALNLVRSMDALSVKSYDEFCKLIEQIAGGWVDKHVLSNLMEAVSIAMHLSVERPLLRPEEKSRFS